MAITLHNIKPNKGSKSSKKRIGRGLASKGRTAGRGQKGQKSRSGVSGLKRLGMRQLILSMPKLRGFTSPHAKPDIVNVEILDSHFGKGEAVTLKNLKKKGLISRNSTKVKILGDGEISKPLTVKGCAISKSAAEKILNANGNVEA